MRPNLARPTDVGWNENVIGAGVDTAPEDRRTR
jgi:hypothetical protein